MDVCLYRHASLLAYILRLGVFLLCGTLGSVPLHVRVCHVIIELAGGRRLDVAGKFLTSGTLQVGDVNGLPFLQCRAFLGGELMPVNLLGDYRHRPLLEPVRRLGIFHHARVLVDAHEA